VVEALFFHKGFDTLLSILASHLLSYISTTCFESRVYPPKQLIPQMMDSKNTETGPCVAL
jgi:hypothetical protein